jgi:hypothetical protein
MTNEPISTPPSSGSVTAPPGQARPGTAEKTEAAKDVANKAVERASGVAGEVTAQTKAVAGDAMEHARQLLGDGRRHLDEEAHARSRQAAGSLRTLAGQLGALAEGDDGRAGAVGDYVRQGRDQIARLADRLDDDPTAVLDDVRRFARRQPVMFLAAAGALGFVAGRLVRGARDAGSSSDGDRSSAATLPYDAGVATAAPSTRVTTTVPSPVQDLAP